MDNGTLLTLGLVGAVAAAGAANQAGVYGSSARAMTRDQALVQLRQTGALSTAILAPLGVSMDQFLRYAQLPAASQKAFVDTLLLRARGTGSRALAFSDVEVPENAVFHATTKGGKYQIVVFPAGVYGGVQAYDLREYTQGRLTGMGTNGIEGLLDRIPRMIRDSDSIDGIRYLVKKDTLGLVNGEPRAGSRSARSTALRAVAHRVVRATAEESAGMFHPPVVITVGEDRIVTPAGTSDEVSAYRYGDNLLLVVRNDRLPYVGATLYTRDERGPWHVDQDVFYQGSEQAEEGLGARWSSLSATTLARRLLGQMS